MTKRADPPEEALLLADRIGLVADDGDAVVDVADDGEGLRDRCARDRARKDRITKPVGADRQRVKLLRGDDGATDDPHAVIAQPDHTRREARVRRLAEPPHLTILGERHHEPPWFRGDPPRADQEQPTAGRTCRRRKSVASVAGQRQLPHQLAAGGDLTRPRARPDPDAALAEQHQIASRRGGLNHPPDELLRRVSGPHRHAGRGHPPSPRIVAGAGAACAAEQQAAVRQRHPTRERDRAARRFDRRGQHHGFAIEAHHIDVRVARRLVAERRHGHRAHRQQRDDLAGALAVLGRLLALPLHLAVGADPEQPARVRGRFTRDHAAEQVVAAVQSRDGAQAAFHPGPRVVAC